MLTPRLLANAPIREAVVEVRVSPLETEPTLPALEEMARAFPAYPTVQPLFQFQGSSGWTKPARSKRTKRPRQSALERSPKTRRKVIQVRLNGISISRLQPYVSWDQLRELSEAHWAAFRDSLGLVPVRKVGGGGCACRVLQVVGAKTRGMAQPR